MKHPEQPVSPAVASAMVCALESILFDEWQSQTPSDSRAPHPASTHELRKLFLLASGQARLVVAIMQ